MRGYNLFMAAVGLVGFLCGAWFLLTPEPVFSGRWIDAACGAAMLGNLLMVGANVWEAVTGNGCACAVELD
jgi:hypothetical protein